MTPIRFRKLLEKMELEEHNVLLKKGEEYTQGGKDRLKNFKVLAEDLGISPLVVWFIYFKKHVDSVANYVKTGEVKSDEPIEGRITDIRNYCALGRGLIEDIENNADIKIRSVDGGLSFPPVEICDDNE